MASVLETYLPNLMNYQDEFIKAVWQTIEMVVRSGVIAFVIGITLGVILVVTREDGILENKLTYQALDKSTNLLRSIPFVILITFIAPLTRTIAGTSIGIDGAIVPLVIGCVPFLMRQVDMALSDIDSGSIEAATAMGVSPLGIIFRVYLKESIPALVRATTITIVSLIGLTAMAGIVGGGGLGDFVTRYGHARYMHDITNVSVLVILIMISVVQGLGTIIIKKTTH